MGVPAFFRWLSRKYPSVIIECVEKKFEVADGQFVYEDASLPNPNGIEFDNLYLDMNGIIHPCTHPEDKPAPKNEDEMMVAIFECIDRLFNIVRPRKVLYMAIDGVAPRAKMNQQRSRRFRASKEAAEKTIEIARIREELLERGCILPPEKEKGERFDSNCITPGTPFMDKLSKCLQYYIHERLNNNPAWSKVKVILSDANVPGEGEHKIMDYIRKQRAQPNHDPNTQHVLCGADADLIMLGLATHEPNFTIIREEFLPNKPKPCEMCNLFGHETKDCNGLGVGGSESNESEQLSLGKETNFIFVRLSVLKEYLERELEMPDLPFPYEFERVIDDWVFMCFFVGNDFLPHLPSLEIREGAIDRLVNLYKKCVYKTGGYLTDSGEVALERVEMIMTDLGYMEDTIFKDRQRNELRYRETAKRRKQQQERSKPDFNAFAKTQFSPTPLGVGKEPIALLNVRQDAANFRKQFMQNEQTIRGQKRSSDAIDEVKTKEKEEEEEEDAHDEVRLWENGFKDRYYQSKFDVDPDDLQFRNTVALEYVRGLCWVLKYYYQGCVSWGWYFPYHYAPFASDFLNMSGLGTKFERGEPFKPIEQLMGVFPAASRQHVPEVFAKLMLDPKSAIIDFYPEDFKIDLNGKKFAWQGVALLPFVDERRLFKALKNLNDDLTIEEKIRNTTGEDRLFVNSNSHAFKSITDIYISKSLDETVGVDVTVENVQCMIMKCNENIKIDDNVPSPLRTHNDIPNNKVTTVYFKNPNYKDDHIFLARRLRGAESPTRVLKAQNNYDKYYKPVIGFNSNERQQVNLGRGGHRMVNHYIPNRNDQHQWNNRNPSSNYPQQGYSDRMNHQTQHFDRSRSNNFQQNQYGYRANQHHSAGPNNFIDDRNQRQNYRGNNNQRHQQRSFGNNYQRR